MNRKNGLIGLAFLCVTIPIMLVAQPAEKKALVGVWEVKISAGGGPSQPLLSIASFGGDGSFSTSGNTKFPQGLGSDGRGPGYGRWAQTGDKEFKLTFYAVLLKDGEVNGYMQVQSTLILSESGNEFTSRDCKVDFMDADRKVLDSDKDQVKGTRLETPQTPMVNWDLAFSERRSRPFLTRRPTQRVMHLGAVAQMDHCTARSQSSQRQTF
jgi:hypothetical protein